MLTPEEIYEHLESRSKLAEEKPATAKASPAAETAAPAEGQAEPSAEPTQSAEQAAQPDPVKDVLAEYGAAADLTGLAGFDAATLRNRLTELESELALERERKYNPVYNLSEDEFNDQIGKLRDDGKHTEAEKMLKEWSTKDQPTALLDARRKAAEREVLGYISQGNGNEKLAELLQDKTLQPVLQDLTGVINLHLPGAARVLHRFCLGLKVAEIARKAEEKGRNSITMSPPVNRKPGGGEHQTTHSFTRKKPMSERLNF